MKIDLEIKKTLADVIENAVINFRHVKLPRKIKVTFQNCQVPEKVTISLSLTDSLDWLLRMILDDPDLKHLADKLLQKLKDKSLLRGGEKTDGP